MRRWEADVSKLGPEDRNLLVLGALLVGEAHMPPRPLSVKEIDGLTFRAGAQATIMTVRTLFDLVELDLVDKEIGIKAKSWSLTSRGVAYITRAMDLNEIPPPWGPDLYHRVQMVRVQAAVREKRESGDWTVQTLAENAGVNRYTASNLLTCDLVAYKYHFTAPVVHGILYALSLPLSVMGMAPLALRTALDSLVPEDSNEQE